MDQAFYCTRIPTRPRAAGLVGATCSTRSPHAAGPFQFQSTPSPSNSPYSARSRPHQTPMPTRAEAVPAKSPPSSRNDACRLLRISMDTVLFNEPCACATP